MWLGLNDIHAYLGIRKNKKPTPNLCAWDKVKVEFIDRYLQAMKSSVTALVLS